MRRREVTVIPGALRYIRSYPKPEVSPRRYPLTQKELAARAGVSTTAIGMIEAGERQPSMWVAKLIAEALQVEVTDFAIVLSPAEALAS